MSDRGSAQEGVANSTAAPAHAVLCPPGRRLQRGEIALLMLVAAVALGVGRAYALWQHRFVIVCPLLAITGIACPTCGGTRAIVAVAHGHWLQALQWNPAIALAGFAAALSLPLGAVMLTGYLPAPRVPGQVVPWVKWAVGLLIAANWVYLGVAFRG